VPEIRRVLVTGATGYVGGRLVPRLLARGYQVRCLARRPEHLEGRGWKGVETVKANLLRPERLAEALQGMDAAFYLVHSMTEPGFPHLEARAASHFAAAAKAAGVGRVIYLGALGNPEAELSRHLRSRHEVGEILRREGPPLTEFRAAVVVGSGSVSFEIIRYLSERLPATPLFPCLKTRCQPIAIRDVLHYLIACLETDRTADRVFEIGGNTVLTYEEMMRIYDKLRGLRRHFVPAPCLNSRSCLGCARWIGLLTPIPSRFALPLLESLRSEVVCRDPSALEVFPFVPLDYETAVRYALRRIQDNTVETSWTMSLFPRHRAEYTLTDKEGMFCDERLLRVKAPAERVFAVYSGLGGPRGWLFMDWLWDLRGLLDRLIGGVGMRRGRRHPDRVYQGEPLDFWRVERVAPDRLLLLRAEMHLPGKGWLQFESTPTERGATLRQTAYFEPKGLFGHLYWVLLHPLHAVIFRGLAREIKRRAES